MKDLLKKIPKQNYLILILGLILICSIMIPSLARYKNRNTIKDIEVWDGNVAVYMLLKNKEEYYKDPVCKNGYFRGTETYNFVRDVLTRADVYIKNIKE